MALIIKADMPTMGCTMCFAKRYSEEPFFNICKITSSEITEHVCDFSRPSDCPILGEIPDEHGRLGDLDELSDKLTGKGITRLLLSKKSYITVGDVRTIIDDAPTVVEASK